MTFQFTCAVRIEETGELMEIDGLLTPPVITETITEAINHPTTTEYCIANKCCVFRPLGK
jgi:hypothetical protein